MEPERWLWMRFPALSWLGGALLMAAFGVGRLLANPAGNSTPIDADYGPDAPLQPWVAITGGMALLCSLACLFLSTLVVVQRFRRQTRPLVTVEPAFVPLDHHDR